MCRAAGGTAGGKPEGGFHASCQYTSRLRRARRAPARTTSAASARATRSGSSYEQCLIYYDARLLRRPLSKDQPAVGRFDVAQPFVEFRITFEHRICRKGKQHGPLLYTVTLISGEKVNLYHSDRYRRTTSEVDRFSVATTFMQYTSAIYQSRVQNSFSALNDMLTSVKTGTSVSVGGGLAGLLGAPSGTTSTSVSVTDHNQVAVGFVSDQFNQSVSQASLLTHAQPVGRRQHLRGQGDGRHHRPHDRQRERVSGGHVLRPPDRRALHGHDHRLRDPVPDRHARPSRPNGTRSRTSTRCRPRWHRP